VLYLSLKHGDGERVDAEGRHFTDATEARLRDWLAALPEVATSTAGSPRMTARTEPRPG
jgi:hypothetical protein